MSTNLDSPADRSPALRRRFQFSLRSLLLFTLFTALVLTSVLMHRRLSEAERELVKLRNVAGYLKIDDESKLYAIALDTYERHTWKWRIYMPKGKKYRWKMTAGDIPSNGIPNNDKVWIIDPVSKPTVEGGEQIVSLAIRKDSENHWIMPLSVNSGGVINWGSVPEELMSKIRSAGSCEECLGKGGAIACDFDKPIVFLRRYITPSAGTPYDNERLPGIMMWLEEVK
jgi:hypothetical protein